MTQSQLDQMADSKYPMPEKWTEPDAGTIHVPDELDSLINQVGFQYRLHTISKRFGEAEFICRAVYACQKYFIDKERAAYIEGLKVREAMVRELEGALGWQPINTAPFDVKVVVGHPCYEVFPVAQLMLVDGEDEDGNSDSWYMWVSEDEDQWEDGTLWPDLGYIEPTHWMPLPIFTNQPTGAKEGE